ncbi:MAG: hypothetical protein RL087_423, partial [Pseudomonadota bacterium]
MTIPPPSPNSFDTLALSAAARDNLRRLGYLEMTAIQAASLPAALQGRDLIAQAKTGSGKTAAFALALLSKLDARRFDVQALVLCPTRELAQQVAHDAIELVKHCRGIRIANVVGGIPYQIQIAKLQNANLVVATPGRLLDLQRSMQIKLDQVRFLVVDEA